jgi:hypothetical protein
VFIGDYESFPDGNEGIVLEMEVATRLRKNYGSARDHGVARSLRRNVGTGLTRWAGLKNIGKIRFLNEIHPVNPVFKDPCFVYFVVQKSASCRADLSTVALLEMLSEGGSSRPRRVLNLLSTIFHLRFLFQPDNPIFPLYDGNYLL